MLNNYSLDLDLLSWKNELKVKKEQEQTYLFDPIRKKWIVLQPEEIVRQLLIIYLIHHKKYNKNRISLERGFDVNENFKRFDILIYTMGLEPFMLIECKAPHVKITAETFTQVQIYNLKFSVPYLAISNGLETYVYQMPKENKKGTLLSQLPNFPLE